MVTAVVVVLVPAVGCAVAFVPDIRKFRHRLGLGAVQPFQEGRVDRLAVVSVPASAAVELEGIHQKLLMACHDVCEVAEGLRSVSLGSDVDVYLMESNA